ncbi:hypothetical protein CDS [Bradyrhizobium sp.]|nr:hypothetical protein CDS [Bradyrhizobium sp.]
MLMPIETVAPLPQVSLEDEMRTFHAPSKVEVAAPACVSGTAMATMLAKRPLQNPFMTRPVG